MIILYNILAGGFIGHLVYINMIKVAWELATRHSCLCASSEYEIFNVLKGIMW